MAPPRQRRATQLDIARRAGVSQATVSLVLSGGPASTQIAEPTRQAVLAAAGELGYSANIAAKSLKGGRTYLLGLYTFEPVFPTDQRDFYYPFLMGVEEEAARQGYDLLLFTSIGSGEREIYTGGVNRLKLADGCVLLGRNVRREELAELVREDFPIVFIGRRELDGAELSYVAADYVNATSDLVGELVRRGHRRILHLRATGDSEPTRDRESGYRRGLAAAGIAVDESLIRTLADPADLTPAFIRHWTDTAGVTAILVEPSEDNRLTTALDVTSADGGVRFPADCSIALLGDPPSWTPELRNWTRYSLPRAEMARTAVQLLISLLDGPDGAAPQLTVPCSFVPGDSIGPAPERTWSR
ncbi:LacI family transcriptional regulator [Nonomuraea sp. MG754425]|uniref:LacI family DNA-binding transcriptional regulator n=1 Tax=Nonomuraea sp. MG754425 TaxID=2570319 RepID=UPI001F2BEB3D|nr:LacI family DNA-binding transcriptional regulator [Nonomuraea sp. MG754425]MCF6470153.1 LacI family transcriptional regulator [Nonomuraea sp. MG754425]